MRKVRVLHVITRMIRGGAQLNTMYTCRDLPKTRFQVDLVTGPELGSEGDLLSEARDRGIRTTVLEPLVRRVSPSLDARAYLAIRQHLQRNDYDIVHTHTSKAGILARQAAHGVGVPIVIHTAHGWQWTPARNRLKNGAIIACERWAARFSDRIIVVAESDRRKGLEAGVGKPWQYALIESGIPMEEIESDASEGPAFRQRWNIPLEAPVAGTVGRFAFQKAPDVMLRAAKRILDADPAAHFVYVGDGPLREEVLRQSGGLGNHSRFHLVGLLDKVGPAISALDVFLLSSRYEGLPRVAVEAMSLGKPVVSTPADGIVDLVRDGENGRIVPHGDGAALAEAALGLLADPERARALGERGRSGISSRFGLKSMVARISHLYEELLAQKERGGGVRPSQSTPTTP